MAIEVKFSSSFHGATTLSGSRPPPLRHFICQLNFQLEIIQRKPEKNGNAYKIIFKTGVGRKAREVHVKLLLNATDTDSLTGERDGSINRATEVNDGWNEDPVSIGQLNDSFTCNTFILKR